MSRLDRFKKAQDLPLAGIESALDEIRTGAKRGHWIWYVFPQLSGMGVSDSSRYYAIDGEEEAAEFLHDPELRARLLAIATAVASRLKADIPASLRTLMGSGIDAQKVVSSLTLFGHVARKLHTAEGLEGSTALARAADQVLAIAASEGYPPCSYTLQRLREPA